MRSTKSASNYPPIRSRSITAIACGPSAARLRIAVERRLLPWFLEHARDLPWRKQRTAYRVWISELMLQQTRVETVQDYYRRWMKSFPSLKTLAEAPQRDVMKAWEGLGYYARARNAHKTAKIINRDYNGRFPGTFDELNNLPGIGPYTAAAVGSLVFGLNVAALDGNVIRVISRLHRFKGDPASVASRRRLQSWADQHLVPGRAGEVNEAMMELGATVCTPKAPACHACPLRNVCEAGKHQDPEKFPVKIRRRPIPHRHVGAGIIINRARNVLLARRPDHVMLGGLWEFPGGGQEDGESLPACIRRELLEELGIHVRVGPLLVTVRHAFTHFTLDLHAYWVRIERGRPRAIEASDYKWVSVKDIETFPLPIADQKILRQLKRSDFPSF